MPDTSKRVVAVDLLRGMTIGLMLVVNYPGEKRLFWSQLRHHPFPGLTLADLVFPVFLFVVGLSISLSEAKRIERGDSFALSLKHACYRAAKLFGLGCILLSLSYQTLRFNMGTLQRIAVCYLIGVMFSRSRRSRIAIGAVAMLAIYQLLVVAVGAPGVEFRDRWTPGMMFTEWLDTLILGKPRSEGVITTIAASANVLVGVYFGRVLGMQGASDRFARDALRVGSFLAVLGIVLALPAIEATAFYSPIHQRFWTPSYGVVTSGISLLVFVSVLYLSERRSLVRVFHPALLFGSNAIAIYIVADLFNRLMTVGQSTERSVKHQINGIAFQIFPSGLAPYIYTAVILVFALGVAEVLYRRKIFFRL